MSIWTLLLIALFIVVAVIPKGTRGEIAVTLMKKMFLDSKIYIDINDVTIQTPNGTTQIDHIIVSKFGIFVVETKNMSGWIFGGPDQPQWTQSLPGGNKFRFQNPLRQNYKHTKSLEEFLGVDHGLIHSVVMFVGDAKFKTEMPDNVLNGGYIPYIKNKSKVLFSDGEVAKMVVAIRTGMMPKTAKTRRDHIESLSARHGHKNDQNKVACEEVKHISDDVISLERISREPEAFNRDDNKLADGANPQDKLTSSKIGQKLGLRTAQFLDRATDQGYLLLDGGKHTLSPKGEKIGVEFVAMSRFGPYFLWPQNFDFE